MDMQGEIDTARRLQELDPPRVAKSGRSFDFAGYRVRLEAGHGDDQVPEVVALLVGAVNIAAGRTPDED